MSDQMTPGSRISDLAHILPDPIEYVSGVVGNFVSYGYDPENICGSDRYYGHGCRPKLQD